MEVIQGAGGRILKRDWIRFWKKHGQVMKTIGGHKTQYNDS